MKNVLKKISWKTTAAAVLIALNLTLYQQGVYDMSIMTLISGILTALGFVAAKDTNKKDPA